MSPLGDYLPPSFCSCKMWCLNASSAVNKFSYVGRECFFLLPAFIDSLLCAASLVLTIFVMVSRRRWDSVPTALVWRGEIQFFKQGSLEGHRQNWISGVIQQSCGCSTCSCRCVPKHPSDLAHCAGEGWWIVCSSMGEQYVIVPPHGVRKL